MSSELPEEQQSDQRAGPPELPEPPELPSPQRPAAQPGDYRQSVASGAIPLEPRPSPTHITERILLVIVCLAALAAWSTQTVPLVRSFVAEIRLIGRLNAFSASLDDFYDNPSKVEYSSLKDSWPDLRRRCLSGDPGKRITSRVKSIDDRLGKLEHLQADRWPKAISPIPYRSPLRPHLLYLYAVRCMKNDDWAALQRIMTKRYTDFYGPRSDVSFGQGPRHRPDGIIVLYAMEHSGICDDPARLDNLVEVFDSVPHPNGGQNYHRDLFRAVIAFLAARDRSAQAQPLIADLERRLFRTEIRYSTYGTHERQWMEDAGLLLGVLKRTSGDKAVSAFLARLRSHPKYETILRRVRRRRSSASLKLEATVFKRLSYPYPKFDELPKEYRQGYSDVSARDTEAIGKMWRWLERDRKQYAGRRAWHTGIGQYHRRLIGYSLGAIDAFEDIAKGTLRFDATDNKPKAGRR